MQIYKLIPVLSLLIIFLSSSSFAQQGPIHSFSVASSANNFTFTPDSQKVVFNEFSVAKVYDLNTQEITLVFNKHSFTISDIDISPDGQWVATGGLASKAFVWNINTGEVKCEMTMPLTPDDPDYRPVDGIQGVDFSDDGRFLLAGTTRAGTWLWDIDKCMPYVKTGFRMLSKQPLEVFPENNNLLIGETVYSIPEERIISGVPVNTARVISPNKIRYLSGLDTKFQVIELNVETQEQIEFPIISTTPLNVALSPDGNFVSIGNIDNESGKTTIFNVETGEPVKQFSSSLSTKINSLVFGRSMKHFAAIHENQVQIFDIGDLTSQILDAAVMDNQ